jgi:hypothetical protein
MKQETQAAGCRTSPPRCSALIRRCDWCQTVTAIDLDNTLKHKRQMQMLGQTVYEVTEDEARTHFRSAGPCRCRQNAALTGGEAVPSNGVVGGKVDR